MGGRDRSDAAGGARVCVCMNGVCVSEKWGVYLELPLDLKHGSMLEAIYVSKKIVGECTGKVI